MLLTEACPDVAVTGTLALQLVSALEGPVLLHLRNADGAPAPADVVDDLSGGWRVLVERLCG